MDHWFDIKSLLEQFIFSENMWRIAGAIGVILLTLLLRNIFVKFIVGIFKKFTQKTKTNLDDLLLEVLEKPLRLTFIILGVYLAGLVIDFSPNVDLFLGRVTRSLILFTLFWAAYRGAHTLTAFFEKITQNTETKFDDMLISFVSNGLKIMIVIIGSISVIQVWFKEIAGILTGVGLGGLVIALAAKDTAANIFGSVTIMIDRPFTIGDWIQTPSVEGTVEDLGFRSTRVRTFSQALVTIPNSVLSQESITNWSRMGKRRINYRLGITYHTRPEQIKECLNRIRQMLETHPEIHPETIFVYFERFGENSLEIFLYFFTKTTNWQKFLEVQEDVNLKIMEILDELEISVALPTRNIYIENNETAKNGLNN